MRTRKTASTSIQVALGKLCGPEDIISGSEGGLNRNDSFIYRPHESIRKVRLYLWKDWHRFFKFAFVRNPWDLVLSWYFHTRKAKKEVYGKEHFDEWVKTYPFERRKKFLKFRQHLYICLWGRNALDFVGRFENLQRDFDYVCKRIGVPTPDLDRLKADYRDVKGYRDYYTPEARVLIAKIFKRDIKQFGYTF